MKLRYRVGMRIIYWTWHLLFGFRVSGRENIPRSGGVIIASNHLSNWDPPLLGTAVWTRECYFFAKRGLFVVNKFFTWLIRIFNAIEVDRDNLSKSTMREVEELLRGGLGLIFFPEGTRSIKGSLLEFNPGVGWLALRTKSPIVPALIKGTNTPLLSQFFRKTRVWIKFGPPIMPDGFDRNKKGRELLTQEVKERIKNLREDGSISDR